MWGLLRRGGAAQRQLLAMIGNFLRSVYKPHSAPSMGVLSSQSGFLRSVYKPHSVQRIAPPVQPSLWTTRYRVVRAAYPGLALSTVGGRTCGDEQSPIVHRRFRPCLALLPAGVTWPAALLRPPVVSYATFSPSPRASEDGGAVCFCGPFRQVNASRRFPRPGYSPTPCSLECGLSSTP